MSAVNYWTLVSRTSRVNCFLHLRFCIWQLSYLYISLRDKYKPVKNSSVQIGQGDIISCLSFLWNPLLMPYVQLYLLLFALPVLSPTTLGYVMWNALQSAQVWQSAQYKGNSFGNHTEDNYMNENWGVRGRRALFLQKEKYLWIDLIPQTSLVTSGRTRRLSRPVKICKRLRERVLICTS